MSIYDFRVQNIEGKEVSLEKYKGKVILVVNTATGCAFTPQYNGLQKLYEKYQDKGFEVLDFPCNQFANEAPGTNQEIQNFCVRQYKITFPQFAKIEVNGDKAEPLYVWLKNQKKGMGGSGIKWNFTKFLVNGEGKVVARFAPTKKPEDIEKEIVKLLGE